MVRWWILAFFLFVVSIWSYFYRFDVENWGRMVVSVKTEPYTIGERTLIIAPHPDDETLIGAGIIQKAVEQKKSVKVVIVTNGDGYRGAVKRNFGVENPVATDFRKLGEIRHQESLDAMHHLGLKTSDILFLGYPDGGINGMWERDWDYNHLHQGLNGYDHSPYAFSFEKQAAYCGENLIKNLSDVIHHYQPTDIIYPDPHDRHHDHWATSAFVKYTLIKDSYKRKEWTFLVHRGNFPYPWSYKPWMPLRPPTVLEGVNTQWHYFDLNKKEVIQKYEAIQKYNTQTRVMKSFLSAFARKNEMLGSYKEYKLLNNGVQPLFFPDPVADTAIRDNIPEADLVKVGVLRRDKSLYVGIETKAPIQAEVEYGIHLRLFASQGIKRIDATVKQNKVSFMNDASNSIVPTKSSNFYINKNQLWFQLPE
ncbi:MAG TPA: PIG-L family deacetylase, partial [Bacillota bacterium]|nr:PIG-L family deacetylase [Bacillota bacterium]